MANLPLSKRDDRHASFLDILLASLAEHLTRIEQSLDQIVRALEVGEALSVHCVLHDCNVNPQPVDSDPL